MAADGVTPSVASRPAWKPKAILIGTDALALALTAVIATHLLQRWDPQSGSSDTQLLVATLATVPLWLALFAKQRLYNTRFIGRRIDEFRRIVNASLLGTLSVSLAGALANVLVRRSELVILAVTAMVVITGISLVLTAPIVAISAIALKLDTRGPVLFRQTRVGQHSTDFPVLKLRTMVTGAEDQLPNLLASNEADAPLFKMKNDPRVTRVGRFLRATSIDELPQRWNVLRGDMSLVGPRPALPHETESWDALLAQRLRVKPGITGMWQVSGRSDTNFEDYTRLDLYYVDNWSLATDVAILARTVPAVLLRRGAA